MPRKHGEGGTFVETVSLEDVLGVFDVVDGPVILSADVADELDCSRETARRKLQTLHERGDLERRKVSRRVVYWKPEVTAETMGYDETARDERQEGEDSIEGESTRPRENTGSDDALTRDVQEYLSTRPPKTDHGKAVLLDVFRFLRENKSMKTGELKDELFPIHGENYSGKRSMWESVSRYLEDVPGIEKGGYGKWAYDGDDKTREELRND